MRKEINEGTNPSDLHNEENAKILSTIIKAVEVSDHYNRKEIPPPWKTSIQTMAEIEPETSPELFKKVKSIFDESITGEEAKRKRESDK